MRVLFKRRFYEFIDSGGKVSGIDERRRAVLNLIPKEIERILDVGVGSGIALGIVKIIFNLPLGYLLLPLYSIAVVLTYLSTEEFVNIAWDSAGVTTGPITVPLVLAMGLGFGGAVGAVDGFGILSMASIGPIIAVLVTGIFVQRRSKNTSDKRSE